MARVAQLFKELDSQAVRSDGDSLRVEVYAIREDGDRIWIQLGLTREGAIPLSLVIRAAAAIQAPMILERIEEWMGRHDRDAVRTLEID